MSSPQVGDIWEWIHPRDIEDCEGPVLLMEYKGTQVEHGMETAYFHGLDLLTGVQEEFIFYVGNMQYWRYIA